MWAWAAISARGGCCRCSLLGRRGRGGRQGEGGLAIGWHSYTPSQCPVENKGRGELDLAHGSAAGSRNKRRHISGSSFVIPYGRPSRPPTRGGPLLSPIGYVCRVRPRLSLSLLPFPHTRCVVSIATPSSLYFFVLGAIRRRSVEHLIDPRYRASRAFLEAALSLSQEASSSPQSP